MIQQSNKFIQCKTHSEGNHIYWQRAIPHIETIVKACGINRSSGKAFRGGTDGYYSRKDDRDGIGFGQYVEGEGFKRGLMAFEAYKVNESDFIPQGEAELKSLQADVFHNNTPRITPEPIILKMMSSEEIRITSTESFSTSFSSEIEEHWEAKATAKAEIAGVGADAEASAGGSIKISTNLSWQKDQSEEKIRGYSKETKIPVDVPAGKTVTLMQKHQTQDMLIKTQIVGVLRPAFFVVDWKKHTGLLGGSKDYRGWKDTKSRIIFEIRSAEDLYNFLTGNNDRYPKQTGNLLENKAVKKAYDFFADADNRSFVENNERLVRDVNSTEYFLDEV